MHTYRKQIELTDTGMVIAKVFCCDADKDISHVGLEFFHNPFDNRASRFEKAHKWANKLIHDCRNYEVHI